jgi:glycolate oxidase iron-sulfur subunit
VQYGHLVDIGRKIVDERVERPRGEKAGALAAEGRADLAAVRPGHEAGAAGAPAAAGHAEGQGARAAAPRAQHSGPRATHKRKVLMLLGCVQPAMMPNINSATARVLDAAGIQTLVADDAGCCGAIRTHLGDSRRPGRHAPQHRRLVAAGPGLTAEGKVEAIVMNASGCGASVKDYGHALAHDPAYADKAGASAS